jgi:hypothetical protein
LGFDDLLFILLTRRSGSKDRLLKPNILDAAIFTVELPVINKFRCIEFAEHSVLLPHLVWSQLYDADPAIFEKLLMPAGASQVAAFWESMEVQLESLKLYDFRTVGHCANQTIELQ